MAISPDLLPLPVQITHPPLTTCLQSPSPSQSLGTLQPETEPSNTYIADFEQYAAFRNFWSWASPLHQLDMAAQWHWGPSPGPSQGYPVHPDPRNIGHRMAQTARSVYGHDLPVSGADYGSYAGAQYLQNQAVSFPGGQGRDDDGLDDFDRHLLGMSELPAAHPQSDRRLSLPRSQTAIGPPVPALNHMGTYPTNTFIPDHHRPGHSYVLAPPVRGLPELSPATTTISNREPAHRHRELHPGLQQRTPPLHSAFFAGPQAEALASPSGLRSSSDTGSLSPAAEASLRKQFRTRNLSGHQPQTTSPALSKQQKLSITLEDCPLAAPMVHGIPLISPRKALPNTLLFQSIFPYDFFNAVQSKCFDSAYGSHDNLVVSAPTGSGKTAILELAICQIIAEKGLDNFKVVYQAPTKALCAERARDWGEKFKSMNLRCAELTGDTSQAEMKRVGSASIIVTTPEKWDSITRKWHDHQKLLKLVGLFLIDEVHILKDVRGATLEAVVSRMKSIGTNVRFVALSATVPNSDDIATWLGQNQDNQHLPARREIFSEELRPVKLEKHVFAYQCNGNDHVFDAYLDSKLPTLLQKHTQGKPMLVFCFTKKSCENTAAMLAAMWTSMPKGCKLWHEPQNKIRVIGRELQELVKVGVAFHHSGLAVDDRHAVEQAFLRGDLSVICCTSTLAVGINLPCHTVVLKGTVAYKDDGPQELSDLEVMQMLGRAGRPQFDDSANALILTHSRNKDRYERMVSGQEILESTLHLNLIEHLNSEIGLRTITDLDSAKKWLGGTFLSVRLRRNPSYYQLTEGKTASQDIDSRLQDICERDIKLLQEANLVTLGPVLKQTEYGSAMTKYMVEFNTMKLVWGIPRAVKMEELLNTLCKATEFKDFRCKPVEKPIFREINKSPFTLYRIDDLAFHTWQKISLLVQLHLGGAEYPDASEGQNLRRQLATEKKIVFERLQRLVRCVVECKGHELDSISTKTATELARSLAASPGAWEGRPSELMQVPQIGPAGMRRLISQGIKTVKDLAKKDYGELERLLGRNPTVCKTMSDILKGFPILAFDLATPVHHALPRNNGGVTVPVKATLRYMNEAGLPKWNKRIPFATFMAETTSGVLVYWWRGGLQKIQNDTGLDLHFSVEVKGPDEQIQCHFSCEEIVGTIVSKSLKPDLPASGFDQVHQPLETHLKQNATTRSEIRNLDDGGFADEDMLEAAALLELLDNPSAQTPTVEELPSQVLVESSSNNDDFPLIDEVKPVAAPLPNLLPHGTPPRKALPKACDQRESSADAVVEKEPVQLPNGRYRCNHTCTGGILTKAGKKCTHKCCLEGLGKPRKPPQPKKRKADESVDADAQAGSPVGSSSASTKGQGLGNKRARLDQASVPKGDTSTYNASQTNTLGPRKAMKQSQTPRRLPFDESDMEVLDLLDDMSDGDDGLPDLSGAHCKDYKSSNATDAQQQHASTQSRAERQTNPRDGAQRPISETKVEGQQPSTATTDYGGFDDVSQEFLACLLKGSFDRVAAFRPGGEDKMLYSGISLSPPPKIEDNKELPRPLCPDSYRKALREASRMCDIDSLASSSYLDRDGFSPENHESPEQYTTFKDTKTPGEDVEISKMIGDGTEQNKEVAPSATPDVVTSDYVPVKQEVEPAWVQDFDQEVIDSLRGFVDFV